MHVQSDAEQMAFRSNSFNAALAGFGMRNLTHMDKGSGRSTAS